MISTHAYRATLLALICLGAALVRPGEARTQGILDKVKDTAEQAAEQEALTIVEEKAREAVRCLVSDLECIRSAESAGDEVVYVDDEGEIITDGEGEPIADREEAAVRASAADEAGAGPAADAGTGSGAEGNSAAAPVGTVDMMVGSAPAILSVRTEGDQVVTGYASRPTDRGTPAYVSLTATGSGERVFLRFVVDLETGEQHCDPLETRLHVSSRDNGSALPPRETEGPCPGIAVERYSRDATGIVSVSGSFAFVTDEDEPVEGRFEADVPPLDR